MPDAHYDEIIRKANRLLTTKPGALVYIKWTCPGCGERVTADDPNKFCTAGYLHTEKADGTPCGAVYHGELFGMMVIVPTF